MEQCAGRGTECAGVTFGGIDDLPNQCYLHERMVASDGASSSSVVAAIRTSNEEDLAERRQTVENGDFDGPLDPWISSQRTAVNAFEAKNNAAVARLALASPAADIGAPANEAVFLRQEIGQPVASNTGYYVTMDVSIEVVPDPGRRKRQNSSSDVTCQIDVQNGLGDFFYSQTLTPFTGMRKESGSGTTQNGGVGNIIINAACEGSADIEVSFANFAFFVFQTTNGPNDCEPDVSVLQNGNFDSDFTPWTTSQGSSTSASFSVSGGQAIVQFSANRPEGEDDARIAQAVRIPRDTPYTLTADLFFTIPSGSCNVAFRNELEAIYYTGQVTSSQRLPVRFDSETEINASEFAITVNCYSAAGAFMRVGIESVGLVLNPGQTCPTTD